MNPRPSELDTVRRLALVLLISCAIALILLWLPRIVRLPVSHQVPSSLWVHSLMIVLSLGAMVAFGGPLRRWGFVWPASHLSPRIVLWSLPMAVLSVFEWIATRGTGDPALTMPKVTVIGFVWVYASFAEELFTRGFLQSSLKPLGQIKLPRIGQFQLTIPIITSALFFGLMHLSLWRSMGPKSLIPVALATGLGIIAAWYRDRSGSLLPPILIHSLFNIGGTLPLWLLSRK